MGKYFLEKELNLYLTKDAIDHIEQFSFLSQWFQLYSIFILSFIEIFPIFAYMHSKSFANNLLYFGVGYVMVGFPGAQFNCAFIKQFLLSPQ